MSHEIIEAMVSFEFDQVDGYTGRTISSRYQNALIALKADHHDEQCRVCTHPEDRYVVEGTWDGSYRSCPQDVPRTQPRPSARQGEAYYYSLGRETIFDTYPSTGTFYET